MKSVLERLKEDRAIHTDKIDEKLAETYFSLSPTKEPRILDVKRHHLLIIGAVSVLILLAIASILFALGRGALTINVVINKRVYPPYENLIFTQKISLLGSAGDMSHLASEYLILTNEKTGRRAGVAIDLDKPIDLTSKILIITAKSDKGGGRLKVIVRDKNFRSYITNRINIGQAWQNFIIAGRFLKESVDMRRVCQVRLEFDDDAIEDEDASVIYVKRVFLTDN